MLRVPPLRSQLCSGLWEVLEVGVNHLLVGHALQLVWLAANRPLMKEGRPYSLLDLKNAGPGKLCSSNGKPRPCAYCPEPMQPRAIGYKRGSIKPYHCAPSAAKKFHLR